MTLGLVYIGIIKELDIIQEADSIMSATVVCGEGGRWHGIVRSAIYNVGDLCTVYLPDSLIPPNIEMDFMKNTNWVVKMRKFRGEPSEVVIMPYKGIDLRVGSDVTEYLGVTKYIKPTPARLTCAAIGLFPNYIPKTDELHYQSNPDLVEALVDRPYYVTQKMDGSSTTAYRYKGRFGVCSRNLDLCRDENNGYWAVAIEHNLENTLPEGFAIQWETCGPNIQNNIMGLKRITGFVFSVYNIEQEEYVEYDQLLYFIESLNLNPCPLMSSGGAFNERGIELLGNGIYANGAPLEGVVVRSKHNINGKPISFKVINLQ